MNLPIRDSSLVAVVDRPVWSVLRRRVWRLSDGYVVASSGQPLARVIMGLAPGDSREVDHKDGDRLNNRRSNLRVCTGAENGQNRAVNSNSSTGERGVSRRGGKFRARVQVNGRMHSLGSHPTIEKAAAVATQFRQERYAYSRT